MVLPTDVVSGKGFGNVVKTDGRLVAERLADQLLHSPCACRSCQAGLLRSTPQIIRFQQRRCMPRARIRWTASGHCWCTFLKRGLQPGIPKDKHSSHCGRGCNGAAVVAVAHCGPTIVATRGKRISAVTLMSPLSTAALMGCSRQLLMTHQRKGCSAATLVAEQRV